MPVEGESERETRVDVDGMFGVEVDICVAHLAGVKPGMIGSDKSIGVVELVMVGERSHGATECVGGVPGTGEVIDVDVQIFGK